MKPPFVSRRWHDAETAALRSQLDEMRGQRDRALKSANTWHGTASRASELFTDTSIVNDCLTSDLFNLRRRHERAVHAAARYLAALWEARAQAADGAAEQWRAQARREKKRADRLQKQYDDAVGLNTARGDVGLTDSEHWEPPVSLDVRPKGAAS